MARNTGRPPRLFCTRQCPGWPEVIRSTWAGSVVTCQCGARRYRSVSVSKTLCRRLRHRTKGTRLYERLRRLWRTGWYLYLVIGFALLGWTLWRFM